jgi:hypothetical protein
LADPPSATLPEGDRDRVVLWHVAAGLRPFLEGGLVMHAQASKRHHFVPKLLLRPWLIQGPVRQFNLRGYWWDPNLNTLACKWRGLDSFCCQLDLLTLWGQGLARDAIERIFFGEIDTKGAVARDILTEHGPQRLTRDQRCDFARLLLSLDARRPSIVGRLRKEGKDHLVNALNADPEIQVAMARQGISETPASFVEDRLGCSLEDRALTVIQLMVDDPKVGGRLINAHWGMRKLNNKDGSLVLSDRPLIRIHGYDRPGATWVLPLATHTAFVACNDQKNLTKLMKLSGQRFIKATNTSSAMQAERFVFCVDQSHERWLGKYLKPKS